MIMIVMLIVIMIIIKIMTIVIMIMIMKRQMMIIMAIIMIMTITIITIIVINEITIMQLISLCCNTREIAALRKVVKSKILFTKEFHGERNICCIVCSQQYCRLNLSSTSLSCKDFF